MAGLGQANELISRDEGLHYLFAITLYKNHIVNKLTESDFKRMLNEAVETEKTFVSESLPVELLAKTVL